MRMQRNRKFPRRKRVMDRTLPARAAVAGIVATLVLGGYLALRMGEKAGSSALEEEVMVIYPEDEIWKKRPEDPGGMKILNEGLETNRIQGSLFDPPDVRKVRLAPPPEAPCLRC